jgi:uncharacterized protein YndB with AHSA1/START domain
MWFDVEPVPLSFRESSPHRIEITQEIDAPPARVFAVIEDGERASAWFADIQAVRWTSPPPHGNGSERVVELRAMSVKERFLAWEPGERIAFHIYAITLPLVTAMLEEMVLEPLGEGRTRLVWRVHYRPALLMKLTHPIVRAVYRRIFTSAARGLARVAGAGSAATR